MKRNVAILLFTEVEVLDFAGPFEVFAAADELHDHDCFNVFTVADSPASIRTHHGLTIVADYMLETSPSAAVLIVPGGIGTRRLLEQPRMLEWVRTRSAAAEITMSVCTGALVLAKAGLLDGLRITTHHGCLDLLRELAPRSAVVDDVRFTDNGRVLTAAGISAGIDCSLHVVGRLLAPEAAERTARHMEYQRA